MLKQKSKEWLKRYLPAEIVGTFTAIASATIGHYFYKNTIVVAYFGSIGEAIGFYSTVLIQNIAAVVRQNDAKEKTFTFTTFIRIISNILLEFGPAGLFDGLILRPFFMYIFPVLLAHFTLGIFVGKIAGDISFYFLVILSYEMRKRHNLKIKSHE